MLSKLKRMSVIVFIIAFFPVWGASIPGEESNSLDSTTGLTGSQKQVIEEYIEIQMKTGKIPGMAVVIVKGDKTVYMKGFGYANLKTKQPVTPQTLFELGSTSKAFTALGILLLEKKGLLNMNDPVNKYLPWFKVKYKGKGVPITIQQLVHHTSGIPFETIGDIPVSEDDNALEETVKVLVDIELHHPPGERFLYATINYDVLGLVINAVTGESFEAYMKNSILEPLGLNQTFLFRAEAKKYGMAVGYKIAFKQPHQYDAPVYRGNKPAGYIITNAKDAAKWLKIQLGKVKLKKFDQSLVEKSHIPNPYLENAFYAKGWDVRLKKGFICHGGANPNFSSHFLFDTREKIGIGILSNIKSDLTDATAFGIYGLIKGNSEKLSPAIDFNMVYDNISLTVLYITVPLILAGICFILVFTIRFGKNKRKFMAKGGKGILSLVLSTLVMIIIGYLLYNISAFLYTFLPWSFVEVWIPISFVYATISIFAAFLLSYLYFLAVFFFPKGTRVSASG